MGVRDHLSRGGGVPEPVRRATSGKVLAWARADDGTCLAGTRDALTWVPDPESEQGSEPTTLPWEQVHRADWDSDESILTVERVEEYGRPTAPRSFRLDEPGSLLPLVWERVTASIVLQRRVDIRRAKGLTVIGRRSPGRGGEITWAYELDRGIDPADPEVMARAEAALREAQESLGLT